MMLFERLREMFYHRRRRGHRHHHPRGIRVFLTVSVDGFDPTSYELHPNRRITIMLNVTAGHTVTSTYTVLDANGNPMLTPPVPTAPATWTNAPSAPGIDTLTVSADGTTSTLVTNPADANATDTLSLSLTIPGPAGPLTLAATEAISISAAPQVPTSVVINSTVS